MATLFEGFFLNPRRGVEFLVLVIARISTGNQNIRSLADQIARCESYFRERYSGPVTFRHIQSQGSGDPLHCTELAEAELAVEEGIFDLVIVEDLSRICRSHRALDFYDLCKKSSTRLIAINDAIDTAEEE